MKKRISVIVPTHNPHAGRLLATVNGLRNQDIDLDAWELVIVDNNSDNGLVEETDLSWHPAARIVKEAKPGLTFARIKGVATATTNILVFVDDDNILDRGYLTIVADIFESDSSLGAIGGKSLPVFEQSPPKWLTPFYESLALRDYGNSVSIEHWERKYPKCAPIGAGMAVSRPALTPYIDKINSGLGIITDRVGNNLSSGGDNEMVLEVLKSGYRTGYFPALVLHHMIPKERLTAKYLSRLCSSSNKSWVQLLEKHGISPWQKIPVWTVPFRKIKAWFRYKAWMNKVNYIKWRGACGTYEGLSR